MSLHSVQDTYSPTWEDFMRYPTPTPQHQSSPLSECTNAQDESVTKEKEVTTHKKMTPKCWKRLGIVVFCLSVIVIAVTVTLIKTIGHGDPEFPNGINTAFATSKNSSTSVFQHSVTPYTYTTDTSPTALTHTVESPGPFTSLTPVYTTHIVESTASASQANSSVTPSVMVMHTTMDMTMTMVMDNKTPMTLTEGLIGLELVNKMVDTTKGAITTGIKPVVTVTQGVRTVTLDSVSSVRTAFHITPFLTTLATATSTTIFDHVPYMGTFMSSATESAAVISITSNDAMSTSKSASSAASKSTGPTALCFDTTQGIAVPCPELALGLSHASRLTGIPMVIVFFAFGMSALIIIFT